MRTKLFAVAAVLTLSASWACAQANDVVIFPKEIHAVLVNPGMGIETFQRFNGDVLNPGLGWNEAGPTTALQPAKVRPDFPKSSIAYCRWFWSVLEPEHGKYNWSIIDLALKEARIHHQTLAIRLMPYDQKHPLPAWYRNSGARRAYDQASQDIDRQKDALLDEISQRLDQRIDPKELFALRRDVI